MQNRSGCVASITKFNEIKCAFHKLEKHPINRLMAFKCLMDKDYEA